MGKYENLGYCPQFKSLKNAITNNDIDIERRSKDKIYEQLSSIIMKTDYNGVEEPGEIHGKDGMRSLLRALMSMNSQKEKLNLPQVPILLEAMDKKMLGLTERVIERMEDVGEVIRFTKESENRTSIVEFIDKYGRMTVLVFNPEIQFNANNSLLLSNPETYKSKLSDLDVPENANFFNNIGALRTMQDEGFYDRSFETVEEVIKTQKELDRIQANEEIDYSSGNIECIENIKKTMIALQQESEIENI